MLAPSHIAAADTCCHVDAMRVDDSDADAAAATRYDYCRYCRYAFTPPLRRCHDAAAADAQPAFTDFRYHVAFTMPP